MKEKDLNAQGVGAQNFIVEKPARRHATVERENLFGNNINNNPPMVPLEIKPQFEQINNDLN